MRSAELLWESDKLLKINDVRFLVTFEPNELRDSQSSDDLFVLGKARSMIDRSVALGQQQRIERVFDMGIYKGGSVVLYDQIFQPDKIVAIDFNTKPVDALEGYISKRSKAGSVKPFYGVDQADRSAMGRILGSEFPERNIDLVVDDASHLYRETRDAFNLSFPYLRAGGTYVIEDWAWAHWAGLPWQTKPWHVWKERPFGDTKALSNLLIELFMLAGSRPDLIDDISVNYVLIIVTKGSGAVPDGEFDIGDHYLLRGKRFRARL